MPLLDVGGIRSKVDELEFQARGLADQALELLGVLHAGNLDEHTVGTLGDDGDFLGATRIDAAADDVAGDAHRILHRLRCAGRSGG